MKHHNVKLILASQSPRRRELLTEAGYEFSVIVPDDSVEDTADQDLPPDQLVIELAFLKAQHVARSLESGIVLAADTIAHCDGEILGKPNSRDDARRMLKLMSGRAHRVLTGVCLWNCESGIRHTHLEITSLRMDELRDSRLEEFLNSGGWQGKAGGFGYQDGLDWVHLESGLASNVVGLPVERLADWIFQIKLG
jgi:septum formation protein